MSLTLVPLLADVTIWPYHSGNSVVDVVLFIVWAFIFGLGFTWGARVAGKLP